jgi:Protein of unknown function (DUF2721)
MEISINTPALLFPAISLLLLAYTNRFLAIANLVRKLHDEYNKETNRRTLVQQMKNLRRRLNFIRYMQGLGVFSFLLCVVCMYSIYNGWMQAAKYVFALSLLSLLLSLVISLIEIWFSTKALELELSDIEELTEENFLSNILGFKSDDDQKK